MTIISLILFAAYVLTIIFAFGIPTSLSESYYLLESKKKGLGSLFSLIMFAVAFTLVMPIMDYTPDNLRIFAFIPIVGIGFVGAAPLFKDFQSKIHTISAGIAAVGFLTWLFIVCPENWIFLLLSLICFISIMLLTKTKRCYVFWGEMIIFATAYMVLIKEAI